MQKPSTSDQADLALLAILFLFLVLFSASMSGDKQNKEQRHDLPQAVATTADAVVKGRAI